MKDKKQEGDKSCLYGNDMQALLTPEHPHPPCHPAKKTGYGVEHGRVGLSRVAPPSHRQEKSARRECQF